MWAAIGVHIVRMDHVVVVDVNDNVSREIMGLYGHLGGSSCYVHTTRN